MDNGVAILRSEEKEPSGCVDVFEDILDWRRDKCSDLLYSGIIALAKSQRDVRELFEIVRLHDL